MQGVQYETKSHQIVGASNKEPHAPLNTVLDVLTFLRSVESLGEQASCILVAALVAVGRRTTICPVAMQPSPLKKGVTYQVFTEYLEAVTDARRVASKDSLFHFIIIQTFAIFFQRQ